MKCFHTNCDTRKIFARFGCIFNGCFTLSCGRHNHKVGYDDGKKYKYYRIGNNITPKVIEEWLLKYKKANNISV